MTTLLRSPLVVVLGCVLMRPAAAQPPIDLSPSEMLMRADSDGDGTVTRDEFMKARTAMLAENFTRMDTNGDGSLDAREAEAAAEQFRSMAAGGRAGFRRPDGSLAQRPDTERPQRPDGGRPQRPGAGANADQAFDRFDSDGDGTLSREEFAEGMARMRAFMQGAGPGPGGAGRPGRGGRGPEEGFRRPPQQD